MLLEVVAVVAVVVVVVTLVDEDEDEVEENVLLSPPPQPGPATTTAAPNQAKIFAARMTRLLALAGLPSSAKVPVLRAASNRLFQPR